MKDDYTETVVMDITPGTPKNQKPAVAAAEKIQASISERNEASSEDDFIQTYSYLT